MAKMLTRRRFLERGAALIGCSAAAHPLMSTVTLAAAPWDTRLVVIILRGGMDGLDVVRPVGDAAFAAARPGLAPGTGLPLDGFFELHPALAPVLPLWHTGELGFVHAVSTPYRNKRSHFDGQDILEAGTALDVPDLRWRDGWLNRMLRVVPGLTGETAFALGRGNIRLLAGDAPFTRWSPDAALTVSEQSQRMLDLLYHADPLFRDSALEAIALAELAEPEDSVRGAALSRMLDGANRNSAQHLAGFAAERLFAETRIAAFSLNGWDTHKGQDVSLPKGLGDLADVVLTLKTGLGPVWGKTVVMAMTEFGRTVRINGTGGTDHGTGGAMLLAGGAVRGGRVLGQWPGLAEANLLDRRDLMPTDDLRRYAAWAMRAGFGLDGATLEQSVFPGLAMGRDPGILR